MSLAVRDITGKKTLKDLKQAALNHKKNVKIGLLLPTKGIQNQRVKNQEEDHEVVLKKGKIVTVMEVGVSVVIVGGKGIDVEADLRVMGLMTSESASTVKHLKET